jgi:hypothetical protein
MKLKYDGSKLLVANRVCAVCPRCIRYQVVEKRHDNGKLRLSCGHRVKPKKLVHVGHGPTPLREPGTKPAKQRRLEAVA